MIVNVWTFENRVDVVRLLVQKFMNRLALMFAITVLLLVKSGESNFQNVSHLRDQ